MKHNLLSYPHSWLWFVAGMFTLGVPADLLLGFGPRQFLGPAGGVLFVVVQESILG